MSTTGRALGWLGRRGARRLGRAVPLLGTAVAVALVGRAVRRKGVLRGLLDSGLDALPLLGAVKNAVEVVTGDWIPDRAPARADPDAGAGYR